MQGLCLILNESVMKNKICIPSGRRFLRIARLHRIEHECVVARWFSVAAMLVLLTCLFGAGCASNREDKSSRQAALPVTVLSDSIEPLRQQFNADKDKLRVLALLSPT